MHALEDEKDLSKVYVDLEFFEAFTKGFLEGTDGSLTKNEIKMLPMGAKVITLEQGIRFLTDYLDGDVYYKTSYEEQNLDRTRTQLKLVRDMELKWDNLNSIVDKYVLKNIVDYLDGDVYYKTSYEEQNLDRTRTQLKLVRDMELKWDKLNSIVDKYVLKNIVER